MIDRQDAPASRRGPASWRVAAATFVALASTLVSAADFRSTTAAATVWYDAPSTKSKRLYVVSRGYPVEVLVSLERWTKVRDAAGSIGWVEANTLAAKRMLVVKPKMAEVRSAPDEAAPVAFRVGQNVLLEWMETLPNGWTRVRHGEAGLGFVRTGEVFG
ncbi:MAG: SH3 domain-containing protein [Betaproteobacteria bacterium]|nr:SH3 domain-containing protein [Betaproteobacteria bacterium]